MNRRASIPDPEECTQAGTPLRLNIDQPDKFALHEGTYWIWQVRDAWLSNSAISEFVDQDPTWLSRPPADGLILEPSRLESAIDSALAKASSAWTRWRVPWLLLRHRWATREDRLLVAAKLESRSLAMGAKRLRDWPPDRVIRYLSTRRDQT